MTFLIITDMVNLIWIFFIFPFTIDKEKERYFTTDFIRV